MSDDLERRINRLDRVVIGMYRNENALKHRSTHNKLYHKRGQQAGKGKETLYEWIQKQRIKNAASEENLQSNEDRNKTDSRLPEEPNNINNGETKNITRTPEKKPTSSITDKPIRSSGRHDFIKEHDKKPVNMENSEEIIKDEPKDLINKNIDRDKTKSLIVNPENKYIKTDNNPVMQQKSNDAKPSTKTVETKHKDSNAERKLGSVHKPREEKYSTHSTEKVKDVIPTKHQNGAIPETTASDLKRNSVNISKSHSTTVKTKSLPKPRIIRRSSATDMSQTERKRIIADLDQLADMQISDILAGTKDKLATKRQPKSISKENYDQIKAKVNSFWSR